MDTRVADDEEQSRLVIGEWVVDPRADEIHSGDRVVKLEPLRMRLLMALARRPGEVHLSGELLDTVWNGVIVTPSSLYQSVAQLRQQLGDDPAAPRYIETVPRKGYRLIAPVAPAAQFSRNGAIAPAVVAASPAAVLPAEGLERESTDAAIAASAVPSPDPATDTRAGRAPGATLSRRMALGVLSATALIGAGTWWWVQRPAPAPRRIAVLPLSDVSVSGADEALARGLTADVNRALAQHPGLEVISQDAVLRLAPAADPVHEAGRQLAADLVLKGDLSRDADQVRVTIHLIEDLSGGRATDATISVANERLAQVPQQVAQRVFAALGLAFVPRPAPAVASKAYELYLHGIEEVRAKTPESVASARRRFTQGIEIDPAFARNYSALATSWIVQWEVGGARIDQKEAFGRAEPLYAKALQLDPNLVEARLGLANVARVSQRYDEARRAYEAVIREHPSNIQAYFGMALVEESDGWPTRAIAHYQRAAILDPTHFLIPLRAGLALMYAGRLAESQASFERSIALDVTRPNGYYGLAILQWLRGELAASLTAYRQALQNGGELAYVWSDYAFACLDIGLYDEARRAFDRATSLLKAPSDASVEAAYAWLAAGAVPPVPAELAQRLYSPAPWERLLILALAGEPVRADDIKALDDAGSPMSTVLYEVVKGRYALVDRATLNAAAGRRKAADAMLADAERALMQYRERGVTAPALDFHRARVAALRGDATAAIEHLKRAVDTGWQRAWWTRRDPAFAAFASDAGFVALLQQMDEAVAVQRRRL